MFNSYIVAVKTAHEELINLKGRCDRSIQKQDAFSLLENISSI